MNDNNDDRQGDDESDPFACFGDDDDDVSSGRSDENDDDNEGLERARTLVREANNRARPDPSDASRPAPGEDKSEPLDPTPTTPSRPLPPALPSPFPERPPLYINPSVILVSATRTGGGRGYVASDDLPPGTLLLVEEPVVTWPEGQRGKELGLISVEAIVKRDAVTGGSGVAGLMERLHPAKRDADGDEAARDGRGDERVSEMMKIMRDLHSDDPLLPRILQMAKENGIHCSNGTELTADDVLRMLLALRCNGFESGLFLNFSMFNHSCDPNCVKFLPDDSAAAGDDDSRRRRTTAEEEGRRKYSEVRTTRRVKRGEELTLHYMDPREVSHATRRRYLWEQHRFDVGDDAAHPTSRFMELVGDAMPPSSVRGRDEDDATFRVEKALEELEGLHEDLKVASSLPTTDGDDGTTIRCFERLKAMELASRELSSAAAGQLDNPNHILLVRCFRLHTNVCETLLLGTGPNLTPRNDLSDGQRTTVLRKFVQSAYELLPLQLLYLGTDHPDVGRTYQDIAQGIRSLLSNAPSKLLSLEIPDFEREEEGEDTLAKERRKLTFQEWTAEENRCRIRHARIESLYPWDAEEHIKRAAACSSK